MKRFVLLTIAILLLLAGQGWAATYYMRADGEATSLIDATGHPEYATDVSKCIRLHLSGSFIGFDTTTFASGDTVLVSSAGGTYVPWSATATDPVLWIRGTYHNNITVKAVTAETPTFDAAGTPAHYCPIAIDEAGGAITITLDGLYTLNANAGSYASAGTNGQGVKVFAATATTTAANVTIKNMNIQHCEYAGIQVWGKNTIILSQNNYISDCGTHAASIHWGTGGTSSFTSTGGTSDTIKASHFGDLAGSSLSSISGHTFNISAASTAIGINMVNVLADGCTFNVGNYGKGVQGQGTFTNNTFNVSGSANSTYAVYNNSAGTNTVIGAGNTIVGVTGANTYAYGLALASSATMTINAPITITNCVQALYSTTSSTAQVWRYVTVNYTANKPGAASYGVNVGSGAPTITQCTFDLTNAYAGSKAIYSFSNPFNAYNNIFKIPSGMYGTHVQSAASPNNPILIYNNNFVGTGTKTGTGIYAQNATQTYVVTNNIFTNLATGINNAATTTGISGGSNDFYSNTADTSGAGTYAAWSPANIASDPLFVTNYSNLHLQSTSPCINTGTNTGINYDYEGAVRPQ